MRSLARESPKLISMIRITIHHGPSRTVVTIEGRLTASDLREIRRVRKSVSGVIALDLSGLDACANDGIRLLQDWLDTGACLDAATPFLQMVLQTRKADDSREEHSPVMPDPDSSNQPP